MQTQEQDECSSQKPVFNIQVHTWASFQQPATRTIVKASNPSADLEEFKNFNPVQIRKSSKTSTFFIFKKKILKAARFEATSTTNKKNLK